MAKANIVKIVSSELEKFLKDNDLELYNMEFVKEGKDRFLRVFIDHKWTPGTDSDSVQGVSTDDCELVSRHLSDYLDKTNIIDGAYMLEVSSPGMDRPLIKEEHYQRYEGKDVEVSLYKAIDGRKKISGKLGKYQDDVVEVTTDGGIVLNLPIKSIAKTKLRVIV